MTWELILKQAKECHTKQAWELLFSRHVSFITSTNISKPIVDLYRLLRSDQQCLQYDPRIWATLLNGCLSCWNLELATEIAAFIKQTPSPITAIPAAKAYMESGHPTTARKTATRALRLAHLSQHEILQLEMLICESYVEEGKRSMAIRLLNRMQETVKNADMSKEDRARFLVSMARTNFFLGRYPQAGTLFYEGYELYRELENWEEAARALHNSASSNNNAGGKLQESAFERVEECRRIAEAHQLFGPLSHVEAFYGHHDYWHGNFAGARDHYRRAHRYLPTSDKSFRTLHVLSMLALIYLRTGQYSMARKFGQKTLDLAHLDESERFRSRYDNLRAELLWEDGQIEESQSFLREKTGPLFMRGVNTLEELSTMSRYYRQSALLEEGGLPNRVKISDQLRKNPGDWIEFLVAQGQFNLSRNNFDQAEATFQNCLAKAISYGDTYHHAYCLLGLIKTRLAQNKIDDNLNHFVNSFEIAIAKLSETPMMVHVHFVRAGLAYRRGDFDRCRYHLRIASEQSRINFSDRYVLSCWQATMEGRSPRISAPWQKSLLGHSTRIYFAPSFKYLGNRQYEVSGNYEVNLARHPALSDLLEFLLERNKFAATSAELQQGVWKQSLAQQGWQQKIRNTVMRLRAFFPFTMAPLIVHDEDISLFWQGIKLAPILREGQEPKAEILRLLSEGPLSSVKLSNRINVSAATTKRLLKKLTDEQQITMIKVGRKVFYQRIESDQSASH